MENKVINNTTIKLIENGPFLVKGEFEIIGSDEKKIELTNEQREKGVYLCRCGKSATKPFCDGAHRR